MKPILFDKNESIFSSNGKGTLDFLSCKITEERNGIFELEGEISEDVYHASEIEMNSIIRAKVPDQTVLQLFRVYNISKPLNGRYTILAQHVSYQLSYIPVMPFEIEASDLACIRTMTALKNNAVETCPFTLSTNVQTVASFGLTKPVSIRNALGGGEGSVLDRFGGEFLWNNYNVSLKKNRGKTAQNMDVILRYGKDITDINQEEYISKTITGVMPFWTDNEGNNLVTLTEKVVNSQYASNYPFKRTVPLDCSDKFEEQPSESDLRTYAQAYVNQAGIGVPNVSIKVKFISLDQDTQNSLQRVKLCDVIGVEFVKLGISTTAKVVKYVYDVLKERYDSIEVGSIRPSLAQTISDTSGAIEGVLGKALFATNKAYNDAVGAISNATAWLTGSHGYVMAVKNNDGTWKELLFMDANDATQATNILRINENGIGFSRNGVDGPYTQAWTLDGKLVIGGTNVPEFVCYKDDSDNPDVLFKVSRDGIIWDLPNSIMSEDGTLSCSNASIKGYFHCGQTSSYANEISNGEIRFKYLNVLYATLIAKNVKSGYWREDPNTGISDWVEVQHPAFKIQGKAEMKYYIPSDVVSIDKPDDYYDTFLQLCDYTENGQTFSGAYLRGELIDLYSRGDIKLHVGNSNKLYMNDVAAFNGTLNLANASALTIKNGIITGWY